MKRVPVMRETIEFRLKPYRFLTEPQRIRKGALHLVLSLLVDGAPTMEIAAITGTSCAYVERVRALFEAAASDNEMESFKGSDLGPSDLIRLHSLAESFS